MEDRLRRKEAELEDMTHKRDSECQRVRELETQLRQLRDLLHEKDREIRVSGDGGRGVVLHVVIVSVSGGRNLF